MIAALLFAAATQLVPAGVRSALVLETPEAAAGVRAFLEALSQHARGLEAADVGRTLARNVGVDLLAEDKSWGLGPGARVLVKGDGAVGLSAPVRNAKAARKALSAWVAVERKGQASNRAGAIVRGRLITASGARASVLVAALAKPGVGLAGLKGALTRARGPLWLYVAATDPLKAGIFALEAGAEGLTARGIVLPARGSLLAVAHAPRCEGLLACLAASVGDAGRQLLQLELQKLVTRAFAPDSRAAAQRSFQQATARAQQVVLRIDGIDPRRLGKPDDSIWALQWSAAAAPSDVTAVELQGLCLEREGEVARASFPCGPAPELAPGADALAVKLDLQAVDRAIGKMSPLDALKGEIAAGALGAHLLYGRLMQHAGPLVVRGNPAQDLPAAAELELHLPLH